MAMDGQKSNTEYVLLFCVPLVDKAVEYFAVSCWVGVYVWLKVVLLLNLELK